MSQPRSRGRRAGCSRSRPAACWESRSGGYSAACGSRRAKRPSRRRGPPADSNWLPPRRRARPGPKDSAWCTGPRRCGCPPGEDRFASGRTSSERRWSAASAEFRCGRSPRSCPNQSGRNTPVSSHPGRCNAADPPPGGIRPGSDRRPAPAAAHAAGHGCEWLRRDPAQGNAGRRPSSSIRWKRAGNRPAAPSCRQCGQAELLAIDGIDRAGRAAAAVAAGFVQPVQFGPCGGHQFLSRTLNFVGIDRRAIVSGDKDRRGAAVQGDGRPSFQHRRQGRSARSAERIEHQFARPRKMTDILTYGVVRLLALVVGVHGIDGRVSCRADRPWQGQSRVILGRRVVRRRPGSNKELKIVVAHWECGPGTMHAWSLPLSFAAERPFFNLGCGTGSITDRSSV